MRLSKWYENVRTKPVATCVAPGLGGSPPAASTAWARKLSRSAWVKMPTGDQLLPRPATPARLPWRHSLLAQLGCGQGVIRAAAIGLASEHPHRPLRLTPCRCSRTRRRGTYCFNSHVRGTRPARETASTVSYYNDEIMAALETFSDRPPCAPRRTIYSGDGHHDDQADQ